MALLARNYQMLALAIRVINIGVEGAAVSNEGYLATALDPTVEGGRTTTIKFCSTLAS